jgi:hypothetical protein
MTLLADGVPVRDIIGPPGLIVVMAADDDGLLDWIEPEVEGTQISRGTPPYSEVFKSVLMTSGDSHAGVETHPEPFPDESMVFVHDIVVVGKGRGGPKETIEWESVLPMSVDVIVMIYTGRIA